MHLAVTRLTVASYIPSFVSNQGLIFFPSILQESLPPFVATIHNHDLLLCHKRSWKHSGEKLSDVNKQDFRAESCLARPSKICCSFSFYCEEEELCESKWGREGRGGESPSGGEEKTGRRDVKRRRAEPRGSPWKIKKWVVSKDNTWGTINRSTGP